MEGQANSIEEVLNRLDAIIAETLKDGNSLGIFAYVYRRTTAQIKQAINEGAFEDNGQMERMDVRFANEHLEAYSLYRDGRSCSAPWKIAFEASKERLAALQHILLGMNAHINYDLGIAASETAPGASIHGLKSDFMKVNGILASLTDEMQARLGRVSRLMFLLDWIGKRSDENFINFSMVKAREQAWKFAVHLAEASSEEKIVIKENTASLVAELGALVSHPSGKILTFTLKMISNFEVKDIGKIIRIMEE